MIITENDMNLIKKYKREKIKSFSLPKEEEELIKKVDEEQFITKSAYTISMISLDNIRSI